MGRDVYLGGERVFYVVGWASGHFGGFNGKKCLDVIPLVLEEMKKVLQEMKVKGVSVPTPPQAKGDSNWWFGHHQVGYSSPIMTVDERLGVVYHTLLEFLVLLSHNAAANGLVQVEGYFEHHNDPADEVEHNPPLA